MAHQGGSAGRIVRIIRWIGPSAALHGPLNLSPGTSIDGLVGGGLKKVGRTAGLNESVVAD